MSEIIDESTEGRKEKEKENSESNPVSLETRCFRDDFSGRADEFSRLHEGKERERERDNFWSREETIHDTLRNIQRYFSLRQERSQKGIPERDGNDLVVETRPFQDQREDVNREFSPNTVNALHHPGEQKGLIKTLPLPVHLEFLVYKREQGETIWKEAKRDCSPEVVKSKPRYSRKSSNPPGIISFRIV